jgi:FkbM family methyltransferase
MKKLFKIVFASLRFRINKVKNQAINKATRCLICFGLSIKFIRKWINSKYNEMQPKDKISLHARYSDLYRKHHSASWSASWVVSMKGCNIHLPLTANRMWLDWDLSLSMLGHDMEIKNFYFNLLKSAESPEMFIDIGANYGTHSLLFMCLGVPSVTFEPNSTCHAVFKEMCVLNNVKADLHHVAIASGEGQLELKYPEKFTWLGSVKASVCNELRSNYKLLAEKVRTCPLDMYMPLVAGKKILIKVDTEGSELDVFKGAKQILTENRPIIVFESNLNASDRGEIADLLDIFKYDIYALMNESPPENVTRHLFMKSIETNFAAWPREKTMLENFDSDHCH